MIYLSCIGMHSLCRKLPPNTIESTGVITAWIQPDGKKTVSPPFTTHLQGGQKKWRDKLVAIILSNINQWTIFFTERFPGEFAVKWLLKIPPHLADVATLPSETLMSINDKLHGNVGVVELLITKLRKVYCWVLSVDFFKSVNIRQSQKQEHGCLVHFHVNHILAWTLPNIHRFSNSFHGQIQQ